MHATGSGIMGDAEYLHVRDICLKCNYIYNARRPKFDGGI